MIEITDHDQPFRVLRNETYVVLKFSKLHVWIDEKNVEKLIDMLRNALQEIRSEKK